MPLLMHVAFDNSCRLKQDEYLFEYNGIPFKLIQNDPRKASDVLLTIVPHEKSEEFEAAYSAAGEFLSALSWENHSRILLQNGGGIGQAKLGNLSDATCRVSLIPLVAVTGNSIGGEIDRLPKIWNQEQKTALALMRDARGANIGYLSFLFFWQVMEVEGAKAEDVVNGMYDENPAAFNLLPVYMDQLDLKDRTLGEYLREDCRNAIAHIKRNQGRREIVMDSYAETQRIGLAKRLAEDFAVEFIKKHLQIGEPVWLVKMRDKEFPIYADDAFIRKNISDIIHD